MLSTKLPRRSSARDIRILSYGCTSGAGPGVESFWSALSQENGATLAISPSSSAREKLAALCGEAWAQASRPEIPRDARTGVILASTKGCIDDFVWKASTELSDPLTPILEDFLHAHDLATPHALVVSNACASSLGALYLASHWLRQGRVSHVAVVAADLIGPFVSQGFACLQALAAESAKPFDRHRDGLRLGSAAAVIVLDAPECAEPGDLLLKGVGLVNEGSSITRPSRSGESLRAACLQILRLREGAPDLVIAHGTGTVLNDASEDEAFTALFSGKSVPITATKGVVGHTLGASGAMDVIAAGECIRRGRAFRIANTREVDPEFRAHYLHQGSALPEYASLKSVLVSSLGFGGTHAAAWVEAAC